MQLNRTGNAARNIVWGTLNKIIHIGFPFVIRTVIIYRLGINYVGLNSLFTSVLSALSMAELGFDTAIVTVMYKSIADNDERSICALLRFIKYAYLAVGLVIMTCGCCCIPFLKYLINDSTEIPKEINLTVLFILFLLNTVISYFFGGYKICILQAYQRQDVISNTDSLSTMVFSCLQIFMLFVTENYYIYVILMICSSLFTNINIYIKATKKYHYLRPSGKVKDSEKRRLNEILAGTFLGRVGSVLSVSFDNIIISSFLGLTVLAYYSNYCYIINALKGFLIIIYTSMQAGIGNSIALESVEKNFKDMLKFSFIYNWIVGWCSICLLYLLSPFITLWIGHSGVLPNSVMVLIVLDFYVILCGSIQGTYKNALGIWWEDRYRCLIGGIVNLILNVCMVVILKNYGELYALAGVVVSTITADLIILTPWSIKVTFKLYFKNGMSEYVRNLILYFVCTAANAALCFPLMKEISNLLCGHTMLILVARGICLLIVPNLFYLLCYRKSKQFILSKEFVLKLIKKKRDRYEKQLSK